MAGSDVRQLLLQVDASVAVAQRNLQNLARQVANDTGSMEASLSRVDKAFSRVGKSAEESAQAFLEGDRAAKRLIAAIDPLFAAQHRYDEELAKANQLYKTGSLSAKEFAQVQAGLKAQLDQSAQSLGRAGAMSGTLRSGMQQLSFQVGDVAQGFALGVKPMTIFAQQGGQIIQTFQLMGGASNKFLAILAGPWGLALQLAASALLLLSTRHKDTAETVTSLVEKMKKEADQARLNEQANKIWANSIDGVIDAQKKLRGEIEQTIRVEAIQNRQNLDKAKDQLADIRKELSDKQEELAKLQSRRGQVAAGLENPLNSPEDTAAIQLALSKLDGKIATVNKRIGELKKGVTDAEKTIREATIPVARDYADAWTSATVAVNHLFDEFRYNVEVTATNNQKLADSLKPVEEAIERSRQAVEAAVEQGIKVGGTENKIKELTQALIQGKIGPDAYTKSVNALAKALQAAADAAKEAKKSVGGTGELANFIMPVEGRITSGFGARTPPTKGASSFHPAIDIAAPVGTPVKAAAGGVVIYTGKLGGLGNVVVVDHGGGTITEYGHLSKILTQKGATVDQGAVIAQVGSTGISTGPHLDYRVKVGGKYVDPRKGRFSVDSVAAGMKAGNAAESAAERQLRNDNAFAEQKDKLNRDLLAAQMELVDGTEEQAKYAHILAKKAEEDADNAIQHDVAEGKLSQAQADELKEIQAKIRAQRDQNIEIHKQLALLRDQDEAARDGYEFTVGLLKGQESLAKTASARRTIELQILDLMYEEKERHLEYLKAQAELTGNTAEAARIQAQINNLPAQKASDQAGVYDQTKGPLESYIDGLPHTADQINEALQSIEAQGLDGLVDALAHVGESWESMRDIALRAIQDILQQLIRLQIQKMLFSLIGGVAGAPGTSIPGGSTGFVGLDGLGSLPGFAGGGIISVGGNTGTDNNLLSINGQPRAWVSASEKLAVIPNIPKMAANNNNSGDTFHVRVTVPGVMGDKQARRTGMQIAAGIQAEMGRARMKGVSA